MCLLLTYGWETTVTGGAAGSWAAENARSVRKPTQAAVDAAEVHRATPGQQHVHEAEPTAISLVLGGTFTW
jgi:hypothetical protein